MQLLIQSPTPYTALKPTLDAEAENLSDAGLTTLQIWHVTPTGTAILFEVAHEPKAKDWLARQSALGHALTATFLKTV